MCWVSEFPSPAGCKLQERMNTFHAAALGQAREGPRASVSHLVWLELPWDGQHGLGLISAGVS